MMSAKGLGLAASRVKLGLLPWPNVQLAPILHYQPQLSAPPSQETRAGSAIVVLFLGRNAVGQHFQPGAVGRASAGTADLAQERERPPPLPHTPTPSRTTGRKNGEGPEMGSPSSILSPCPLPRPQKTVYFWEGHSVAPLLCPAPYPQPRIRDAGRDTVFDT